MDVRDVGSNIYLNMEPTRLGIFIDFNKLYADASGSSRCCASTCPRSRSMSGSYPAGSGRASPSACPGTRPRIFILDEPTAALGVEQQHKVNELIANLKAEGKTVLVISHNLEHVFTVADRLVVLRRGKRVGTRLKTQTTKEEIVGLITAPSKATWRSDRPPIRTASGRILQLVYTRVKKGRFHGKLAPPRRGGSCDCPSNRIPAALTTLPPSRRTESRARACSRWLPKGCVPLPRIGAATREGLEALLASTSPSHGQDRRRP